MCVAVVVPPGEKLTKAQWDAMFRANGDAWGFAYMSPYSSNFKDAQGMKHYLRRQRGVGSDTTGWSLYSKAFEEPSQYPHLVHFRIATAGLRTVDNAHPFAMTKGMMIHNGHLPGNLVSDHSDTAQFAAAIDSVVGPSMTDEQIKWFGEQIGKYNKLAFLWKDGTATIVNEDEGTRLANGVWVSNTYWQRHIN